MIAPYMLHVGLFHRVQLYQVELYSCTAHVSATCRQCTVAGRQHQFRFSHDQIRALTALAKKAGEAPAMGRGGEGAAAPSSPVPLLRARGPGGGFSHKVCCDVAPPAKIHLLCCLQNLAVRRSI